MSVDKQVLITIHSYACWARDQLLDAVAAIDVARLHAAGVGYGPIWDTLVHVAAAEQIWLARAQGRSEPLERTIEEEGLADVAALRASWQAIDAEVAAFLATSTPAQLSREVTFRFRNGDQATFPVWQMLLHAFNHAAEHRGQLTVAMDQQGIAHNELDAIEFFDLQTAE